MKGMYLLAIWIAIAAVGFKLLLWYWENIERIFFTLAKVGAGVFFVVIMIYVTIIFTSIWD